MEGEEVFQTNYISEKDWKEVYPDSNYPDSVFTGKWNIPTQAPIP